MELFAIVGAIPVAFIAGGIYAYLIHFVLRYQIVRLTTLLLSTLILLGILVEWATLLTFGAVRIRAIIGPIFYPIHLIIFFLSIPALANLLVIKKISSSRSFGRWVVIGFFCSALALPVVLTHYGVAEALYGIDGTGGPYGQAPTIPMPEGW